MTKKIKENNICPFCSLGVLTLKRKGKLYYDSEYSQTKRGTKQWFHRSCYNEHIEKQRRSRGGE